MSCENLAAGPPGFNCVSTTSGANVLASLYFLEENGQLQGGSSANGIIANITAYGYTFANTQCSEAFVADQITSIDCNNPVTGNKVFNNVNCELCVNTLQSIIQQRNDLEKEAHLQNKSYPIQVASPDILSILEGPTGIDNKAGVCQYMCFQCVASDVRQNINMKITDNCSTTTSDFRTAWTDGMAAQASKTIE